MAVLLYDITKNCNLRCKHCYNSEYFKNIDAKEHNIRHVVEFIKNKKVSHVHLLGGEPFLSANLWDFIDNINSTVSINTNGTLLTIKNINKILCRNKINQLTISLDGHNEKSNAEIRGSGNFDKVIKNIDVFNDVRCKRKTNIELNLAFVVTPNNLESLLYLASLAKEKNSIEY